MKTEDLSPDEMRMALRSFREWSKQVVIALGDNPTFDYDYDRVPAKIEDLRKRADAAKGAPEISANGARARERLSARVSLAGNGRRSTCGDCAR
jgi:hypothetical protein